MLGSGTKLRAGDVNLKKQAPSGAKNGPSGSGDLGLGLVGTSAPAGTSRSLNSAGNGINVRPVPVATRNLKQEFTFAQPPTISTASTTPNVYVPQSQIMSAVVLPHTASSGQQPQPRSSAVTPDAHSRGTPSTSAVVSLAVNQSVTPLTVAAPSLPSRVTIHTAATGGGVPIPRPPVEEKVTPTKPIRRSFGSEGGVSPQLGARTSPSSVTTEQEGRLGGGGGMMTSCACGDDEELPPLSEETRMSDAVMNQYSGGGTKVTQKKVVVNSPKKDTAVSKAPPKGVGGALWGPPIDEPSYEEEQQEERMPPHGSIVRRLTAEEVAERNRRTVNATRSAKTHVNPPPATDQQPTSRLSANMGEERGPTQQGLGSARSSSGVGTMDRRVASPGTEKKGLLISADFRRSLATAATLVEKHAAGNAPPLYFQHLNQEILRRIQAEQQS